LESTLNLTDTIAVITGAASGLGAATARHLLTIGARGVAILDTNESLGRELVAELGNERCLFIVTDVADADAVQHAIDQTAKTFGSLNVAVNAAAIAGPSKLVSKGRPVEMAKFRRVIEINLFGTVHVVRSAAAEMMKNQPNEDGERGVIINVSSGAAFEGQLGQAAYSASKAAVLGMTFPLMREFAPHGVRVMSIAPGMFDTPIYETLPAELRADLLRHALFPRRMGRPSEFALLVEEIIRNPMHNGRTIRFDAGMILPPV
jgi:NAD(P)-dependent dehydrogenase (short-subunit alcohol dehydrogenase family)